MSIYPATARRIADICDALNKVDGMDTPEVDGVSLSLRQPIVLTDEHGSTYGEFRDEVGGSWAFYAAVSS